MPLPPRFERRRSLMHLPRVLSLTLAWLKLASLTLAAGVPALAGTSQANATDPGDKEARITDLVTRFERPGAPGMTVGIYENGKQVYTAAIGVTRADGTHPLTSSTPMYLASLAKQFTAAAIVLLERQGKVSLDDSIRTWLDEMPEYLQPVTIRHLLHHRSGIRDYLELMVLAGMSIDEPHSMQRIVDLLASQEELNFAPGSRFAYSNSGYLLLAEIVRRVTGLSLAAFAEKEVFTPLGMKNSCFDEGRTLRNERSSAILKKAAIGHDAKDGAAVPHDTERNLIGSGGMYSTLDDLALWDRNLDTGKVGGTGLTRRLLTPPQLPDTHSWNAALGPYAMHWWHTDIGGVRAMQSAGGSFGYQTGHCRVPDHSLAVIVLANAAYIPAGELAVDIARLWLELDETASPRLAPSTVRAFAGIYQHATRRDVVVLSGDGAPLRYATLGRVKLPLEPVDAATLRTTGSPVTVTIERLEPAAGGTRRIRVRHPGEAPRTYEEVRRARVTPDDLAAVAGRYDAPALGTTIELVIDRGRVGIRGREMLPALYPMHRDLYLHDMGLQFTIVRDGEGAVDRLHISTNGIRDLQCVRARPK